MNIIDLSKGIINPMDNKVISTHHINIDNDDGYNPNAGDTRVFKKHFYMNNDPTRECYRKCRTELFTCGGQCSVGLAFLLL